MNSPKSFKKINSQTLKEVSSVRVESPLPEISAEDKLAAFYQSSTDSNILLDTNRTIVSFNKKAEEYSLKVIGKTLRVGSNIMEYVAPGTEKSFMENFENALAGARIVKEMAVQYPGRQKTWYSFTYSQAINAEGEVIGVIFNATDITVQKNAVEDLRKLSLIARHMSNAVVITNSDRKITWVNESFEQISGYSFEEVIGKSPGQLLQGPQTDPETVKYMGQCLDDGNGFSVEIINYSKDGTPYWMSVEAIPVHDHQGKIESFISIQRNITERKEFELKLKEQVDKTNEMLANISDIVTLVNKKGIIIYESNSIKDILGYEPEEIVGKHIFELLHPDDIVSVAETFNQHISRHNLSPKISYRYRHKNGNYIYLESQGNNQLNNPSIAAIVIASRDITDKIHDRKRLERMLEITTRQKESLKEFAHIVSHNIRSHGSNISSLVSMLMDPTFNREQGTYLALLKTSSDNLDLTLRHLNEILDINKLGTDTFDKIKVLNTVNSALKKADIPLVSFNHRISINIAENICVSAYFNYFEDIITELIRNALKFREHGNSVFIDIIGKKESEFVCIEIKDNGIGMDLTRYGHRLFTMYGKLHSGFPGKGFGLFRIRNQLEAMMGRIDVNSFPGEGSVFRIFLPIVH